MGGDIAVCFFFGWRKHKIPLELLTPIQSHVHDFITLPDLPHLHSLSFFVAMASLKSSTLNIAHCDCTPLTVSSQHQQARLHHCKASSSHIAHLFSHFGVAFTVLLLRTSSFLATHLI